MAITKITYSVVRMLREEGLLRDGSSILEIGEANWYGDVPNATLRADIEQFASRDQQSELISRLKNARNKQPETQLCRTLSTVCPE